MRERANVKTSRAPHSQPSERRIECEKLHSVDSDIHRSRLNRLARPRARIRAFAVDHLRREDRWRLRERAAEPGEHRVDLFCGRNNVAALDHFTRHIVSVGYDAKSKRRDVLLVRSRQMLREAGRLTDHEWQDARRLRVERAGMTDATDPQRASRHYDDVV